MQRVEFLALASLVDVAEKIPGAPSVYRLVDLCGVTGRLGMALYILDGIRKLFPQNQHPLVGLGLAYAGLKQWRNALDCYRAATQLNDRDARAWFLLGQTERGFAQHDAAITCLRRATELMPGSTDYQIALSDMLRLAGRHDEAQQHLAQSLPWTRNPDFASTRRRRPGIPRLAVLKTQTAGNTPTRFLVDKMALQVEMLIVSPGLEYPPDIISRSYDAVFNAIADVDATQDVLKFAGDFTDRLGIPVLNPPAAILQSAQEVKQIGHREKTARKYRAFCVGGAVLPYGVSVDAPGADVRTEDEAFLRDPQSGVGQQAWLALNAFCARIKLEFFGVDFGVDQQGNLLVFDCNATMQVSTRQGIDFSYRHAHMERIRDAFTSMIVAMTRGT